LAYGSVAIPKTPNPQSPIPNRYYDHLDKAFLFNFNILLIKKKCLSTFLRVEVA
jgi:hypothetical protein